MIALVHACFLSYIYIYICVYTSPGYTANTSPGGAADLREKDREREGERAALEWPLIVTEQLGATYLQWPSRGMKTQNENVIYSISGPGVA